jgi:hypothetical protein
MNLQQTIRKEITAGVLLGGLCMAGIMWFLVYSAEKTESFSFYADNAAVEELLQN